MIPIKMKWMAIVYGAIILYDMITYLRVGLWVMAVPIIASLLNFVLFFFSTRNMQRYNPKEVHRRREFKKAVAQSRVNPATGGITKHKCAICGRTEKDDPNLEFRFCSKCNGNYEYCQDHLFYASACEITGNNKNEEIYIMKKEPFVTLDKLKEITAQYPTPFHLYDEKGIRENAKALKEAFAWNKGFKEFFAVKATPNPYLIQILQEYGCGCDCSSMTELMLSKAIGCKKGDIMFSSNDTTGSRIPLCR